MVSSKQALIIVLKRLIDWTVSDSTGAADTKACSTAKGMFLVLSIALFQ